MNLDDFNKRIMTPTLFSAIESGALDYAIQSEDCQDIIEANDDLKKVVEARLKVLRETK
jgi:hypothetical protein